MIKTISPRLTMLCVGLALLLSAACKKDARQVGDGGPRRRRAPATSTPSRPRRARRRPQPSPDTLRLPPLQARPLREAGAGGARRRGQSGRRGHGAADETGQAPGDRRAGQRQAAQEGGADPGRPGDADAARPAGPAGRADGRLLSQGARRPGRLHPHPAGRQGPGRSPPPTQEVQQQVDARKKQLPQRRRLPEGPGAGRHDRGDPAPGDRTTRSWSRSSWRPRSPPRSTSPTRRPPVLRPEQGAR